MIKKFFQSVYNKVTNQAALTEQGQEIQDYRLAIVDLKQQIAGLERASHNQRSRINELGRENETLQLKVDALLVERNQLLSAPPKIAYEDRFVMTSSVYDKFARSLEPPVVTNNTTAQGAGYLVGMQRVLEKLREQFVA